ncbi:5-bromo-4-chloroindolyl phosphate hydrolysis family protein [Desulfobacter sp.]|uniref:5-bromo-4-chloroindolyl phosphate hydrolysis family protein n=1 Tax=Desulfobacter sp. TaxID=2294 RepID=UPI002579AE48|nr:5-bromo-4-chloroindolyl phosphate hydrolysis family protein [Desulfobacter sp.]
MQVNWKVNMVISAMVTVGAYFAADTFLEFKWWVDVIIALFFGGIVNQLILRDKKEDSEIEVVPGLTRQELKEKLTLGRDWTKMIEKLARELDRTHPETAAKVRDITGTVSALFTNFEKDPKDLTTNNARRLLNDHLPRAHKFLTAYAGLALAERLTDNEQAKLADMENKVSTIQESFSRHLEAFRNNDFTQLQVEGQSMETIYNLDI